MQDRLDRLAKLELGTIARLLQEELEGLHSELHEVLTIGDREAGGVELYRRLNKFRELIGQYGLAAILPALHPWVGHRQRLRANEAEELAYRIFCLGEEVPVPPQLDGSGHRMGDETGTSSAGRMNGDVSDRFVADRGVITGSPTVYCTVRMDGPLFSRVKNKLSGRAEDFPEVRRKAAQVTGRLPAPDVIPGPGQPTIHHNGLILGRIQAGKTNAMIATSALAIDSGYKLVVVLTSDNTWLYEQTVGRFKKALLGVTCAGMYEWAGKRSQIVSGLKTGGVVMVTTKNQARLKDLADFLDSIGVSEVPALIFDDEADQASLDTNARNPDALPSTINQLITNLRDLFRVSGFVQVTATPQALFLLDQLSPYRPDFIVVIDPGEGYIGGDVYFTEVSKYLVPVSFNEIIYLKGAAALTLPPGLRRALCTFFIGASSKLMIKDSDPYSCLIHISLKTDDHDRVRDLVQGYISELTAALHGPEADRDTDGVRGALQEAYDDLLTTATDLPPLDEILLTLAGLISSTDVQVLNSVNAEKQARYDTPYNILIGGTKLGRGVTIQGLLVTYYGRESRTPQMDTVQQHARMYGYRSANLPLSRIFLPGQLAQYFRDINLSENELREWLKTVPDGTYFEPQIIPTGMRATRNNVLNPATVGCYVPGRSYGPSPAVFQHYKDTRLTADLDAMLGLPGRGDYRVDEITIGRAIQILELIKTGSGGAGRWEDNRVREALRMLRGPYEDKACLAVFSGRRLKLAEKPNIADSADLTRVKADVPGLLMFRQDGRRDDDWSGVPFWIPVVRFPDGRYPIAFNFSQD